MWSIPPEQDAALACRMEQVLEVYRRRYDPKRPIVCMDEQPRQLISEARQPIAAAPGRPARVDYEYVREGTCTVWMLVEPLGGWRDVRVTATRTAVDWAHPVRRPVDDPRYAEAERITPACDNLVTHDPASLSKAFGPAGAPRPAREPELAPTPKHGSWPSVAESELGVPARQCPGRRIATQAEVAEEAGAWGSSRNAKQVGVEWHFTTEDARVKLEHLYPKLIE
jgi:hypothetical protein